MIAVVNRIALSCHKPIKHEEGFRVLLDAMISRMRRHARTMTWTRAVGYGMSGCYALILLFVLYAVGLSMIQGKLFELFDGARGVMSFALVLLYTGLGIYAGYAFKENRGSARGLTPILTILFISIAVLTLTILRSAVPDSRLMLAYAFVVLGAAIHVVATGMILHKRGF